MARKLKPDLMASARLQHDLAATRRERELLAHMLRMETKRADKLRAALAAPRRQPNDSAGFT